MPFFTQHKIQLQELQKFKCHGGVFHLNFCTKKYVVVVSVFWK